MAVKVKSKTKKRAVKSSNNAKKLKGKKLSVAKCAAPGADGCPLQSKKDSPYMYQKGCRAEPCATANRKYYKKWRDKKARKAEAAKRKRAAQRKARKATPKKRVTKRTTTKK